MAKITDLVKTYRMLSDPNAPDWNVKFVGAIAVAAIVVAAGAGAFLWSFSHRESPAGAPAATLEDEPAPPAPEDPCALPAGAPTPPTVPVECADATPAVLP